MTGGKTPKTVQKIYREILRLSVKRGRDATGLAATMQNGKIVVSKNPTPSPIFIDDAAFKLLMDRNPLSVIGHVRAATKGSPMINGNNHPIMAGNIVGVHNGVIQNDEYLTKHYNLKRNAIVDSEVIFRLLDKLGPLDKMGIQRVLSLIKGHYALAFQNAEQPEKIWLVRGPGRPLVVARDIKLNTMWFASEANFILSAYRFNNRSTLSLEIGEMEEGEIMSISCKDPKSIPLPPPKKKSKPMQINFNWRSEWDVDETRMVVL